MILNNIYNQNLDLSLSPEMVFCKNEPRFCFDLLLKRTNSDLYKRLIPLLSKDLTVVDAGSNIGFFSLFVLPACKTLIAIEPIQEHYEIYNKVINQFYSELPAPILHKKALLSESKTNLQFFRDNGNSAADSFFPGSHDSEGYNVIVDSITLQEVIKDYDKIDFLKINIEGAEVSVIMDDKFDREFSNKLPNILVQYHLNIPGSPDNIIDKLKSLNYNIIRLNDRICCEIYAYR